MRRADRLFQIIQILQRKQTVVTAREMADELEVSLRTIYRDIQDLMGNRVPIQGERGTGYILQKGFDLPPLMFSEEEIDAVMLGVHWVQENGDPDIRRAADDILRKIEMVLPDNRRNLIRSARQVVPKNRTEEIHINVSMPLVRQAIRDRQKAKVRYKTDQGVTSNRTLSPLLIVFFQNIQILVAWCDLRQDFRNFRMDRFESFDMLEEQFSSRIFDQLDAYYAEQETQKQTKEL